MDKIKAAVLKRITPDEIEERDVNHFVSRLHVTALRISKKDVAFCGSIGKSTWLKGDHDIDLFIIFPKSVGREELEKKGLEYGKKIANAMKGKFIIKYAEHPYVQAVVSGFKVDIVPCYKLEKGEKIKSAVDRSPLHMRYITHKFDTNMIIDVHLLKQFCKGVGVYGSDAKNLGFSGYICELLILNYGSFENVLASATTWKPPQLIDVENHLGNVSIKDVFSDQPLLIIDPIDQKRNAAANLSSENFMRFIKAAKAFLAKPNISYFFPPKPKPLSAKEMKTIKDRGTMFLTIKFKKPDIIDDNLYPQLRRSIKRIENMLKHNDFVVIKNFEYVGKDVILVFELEVWSLPNIKKMVGPPIFSQKHSKEFLTKYKSPQVEGARWVAEKNRKFVTAFLLLKNLIGLKPNVMMGKGIPDQIAKAMIRAELPEFFKLVTKNKDFSVFLRKKYF